MSLEEIIRKELLQVKSTPMIDCPRCGHLIELHLDERCQVEWCDCGF